MKTWLVRNGKTGENDTYCIEQSRAIIGWTQVGDLAPHSTWEDMINYVAESYPDEGKATVTNFTGQLYSFSHRIELGDLVVLPLRTARQLAIGRVVGEYSYALDEPLARRHHRRVEWLRTDVPRTAVKQDLLYSLGAFMTVCEIRRNDATWRIEQIIATGVDPGSRVAAGIAEAAPSDETVPENVDVVENAADRLRQYVAEEFAGHDLAALVGAVLEAEGFVCDVSPEGPDGGIDIRAGRGLLGLDSPRLLVQVKSGPKPVEAPVIQQLNGVISKHGAEQGLLVAWGGVNKGGKKELDTLRFELRVWDADDLIANVCKNYDRLPEDIRARLPLRQIWTIVEDAAT